MPKTRVLFACQQCGHESPKWAGRCPECGAWNSYVEQVRSAPRMATSDGRARAARSVTAGPQRLSSVSLKDIERLSSGLGELDRVLGGGIVPGSLVLIGGDPGIGKSTLLLEAAANVATTNGPVLYVSGEESSRQVRLRAQRINSIAEDLYVLAETNVDGIIAHVEQLAPRLVIVDSIQTVFAEDVPASAGNVSQLRECTLRLMSLAKGRHVPIFLVGHVTKEGNIAGPRTLEHIVDCVLYLEGERFYAYRILRAAKNRYGSTNEVGVFEMDQEGMRQVPNPSAAFLAERLTTQPGSAVTVPLEGSRALLVEVQALTAPAGVGIPRRTAIGVDLNRLQLLVAVLGKRVGLPLSMQDIYVNVVAGLKIAEPAIDLGIALAIASSYGDAPVPSGMVAIGEIGLLGELRPVAQLDRRVAEAARLGFERAIVPASDLRRLGGGGAARAVKRDGMVLAGAETVREAVTVALGSDVLRVAARSRAPNDDRPLGSLRTGSPSAGRQEEVEFDDESLFSASAGVPRGGEVSG